MYLLSLSNYRAVMLFTEALSNQTGVAIAIKSDLKDQIIIVIIQLIHRRVYSKGFNYFEDEVSYQAYVEALKCPEAVNGYRKIRTPKMDLARARAAHLVKGSGPTQTGSGPDPKGSVNQNVLPKPKPGL